MRHSPEEPESKSYVTFSEADIADDEFMIEWLLLAAETVRCQNMGTCCERGFL